MKKIKDMPNQERPREKLLAAGAQSLSDTELLAIILGRGTQKHDVLSLARKLIKTIDEKGLNIIPGDTIRLWNMTNGKNHFL